MFLEWESRLLKPPFLQFSVLMASSLPLEVEKFCLQIELLGESVTCVSEFRTVHYNISEFLKCYVAWTFCEFSDSLNDLNRVDIKENCAIIELLMPDNWIWRLLNVYFVFELQDQWCVFTGLGKIQMCHCRYKKFSFYFRDFYVINHDINFVPNPVIGWMGTNFPSLTAVTLMKFLIVYF
jgi:hypothetical protein